MGGDYAINDSQLPAPQQVLALYETVGWSAYTSDPGALVRALANSDRVITATTSGGHLVGLARAISDGEVICYVQDIVVHPDHQQRGLGRALLDRLLGHYTHVRQRVLLTDADPAQHTFYAACGFTESRVHPSGPLHAFVRLGPESRS